MYQKYLVSKIRTKILPNSETLILRPFQRTNSKSSATKIAFWNLAYGLREGRQSNFLRYISVRAPNYIQITVKDIKSFSFSMLIVNCGIWDFAFDVINQKTKLFFSSNRQMKTMNC